jgi:hypothetical protein
MDVFPDDTGQIEDNNDCIRGFVDVRMGPPGMFSEGERRSGDKKHVIEHILNLLLELAPLVFELDLDVPHFSIRPFHGL